ncbi:MAG: shikimate dehydrogenase [Pseudomonadota bacterium]
MAVKTSQSQPLLAGVIGSPVAHSLSPVIHGEWARRERKAAYYIPMHVEDDDEAFNAAIHSLMKLGFSGVNITLPHKERAIKCATRKSQAAEKIGAANMLTFIAGDIIADNSDAEGFKSSLLAELDKNADNKKVMVLGAGGSARAVLHGLSDIVGITSVFITNRTKARAQELASKFGVATVAWDDRASALEAFDIIINTTSLGMTGKPPLSLPIDTLKPRAVAMDIIYSPLETAFLKSAKQAGAKTVNGLEMLMHQAVPGYKSWLGDEAIVDDGLRQKLLSVLSQRDVT